MRDKKERSIYESLSSFKDGEASVFEEKRIFKSIVSAGKNSEIRKVWKNYWRISESVDTDVSNYPDISDNVLQSLASTETDWSESTRFKISFFESLSQIGIAASFAFLTILGVQNFTINDIPSPIQMSYEAEVSNADVKGPVQQYPIGWSLNRDVNLRQANSERNLGPVKAPKRVKPYVIRVISIHDKSNLNYKNLKSFPDIRSKSIRDIKKTK